MALHINFPLATALRAGVKGYTSKTFRDDALAGLVVSFVALPLSMALAIAVGLPPQHGLYTAIVAGIAAAIFGGSATQVSGPTAAFVVIIAPIVQQFGLHGIIWCQILAGVLLLALGLLRLGKFIHHVPFVVVTGFTAGIAVTIGTLALNDFFGLSIENLQGHYFEKAKAILAHLPHFHPAELSVGLVTLLTIIFLPKALPKIPSPLPAIVLGTLLAQILAKYDIKIDTLNTRFSFLTPEGVEKTGIPPYPPVFHLPGGADSLFAIPSYAEFTTLLIPALVIAALAALESLLSATVADNMTQTKHDPDAELNGIGIANILSGLVAGIPATGAIARTSTNIHAGAKTPVASILHALFLLLYMMTLASLISHVPMAALAALLLMVAWRMAHIKQFTGILKAGTRDEILVLLVCFTLTVFIDMVAGVSTGIILSFLLSAKRRKKITD